MGQTDLYRINFNRSQRSEIDLERERTQLRNCHDREEPCNFEPKRDLHRALYTFFHITDGKKPSLEIIT